MHKKYAKTKAQIRCAVTAKLIRAFVFVTRIVLFLFFLNSTFQASGLLPQWYRQVCVRPGRKPRRPVFSHHGSNSNENLLTFFYRYLISCKSMLVTFSEYSPVYSQHKHSRLTCIHVPHRWVLRKNNHPLRNHVRRNRTQHTHFDQSAYRNASLLHISPSLRDSEGRQP